MNDVQKEWLTKAWANNQTAPYIPSDVGYPPGAPRLDGGLKNSGLSAQEYFKQPVSEPMMSKTSVRSSVLNEANGIVNGARAQTYGGPEDSFNTIAGLWAAYKGVPFSAPEVAVMLGLLKIARLKNSPDHRDSWVDLAGYAACGAECGLK